MPRRHLLMRAPGWDLDPYQRDSEHFVSIIWFMIALRIIVVPHLPSSPTRNCRGWWWPAGNYQSIIYSHFGLHASLYGSRLISMLYINCFECDKLQRNCSGRRIRMFKFQQLGRGLYSCLYWCSTFKSQDFAGSLKLLTFGVIEQREMGHYHEEKQSIDMLDDSENRR